MHGIKRIFPLLSSSIATWLICGYFEIEEPLHIYIWFLAWYTLLLQGTIYITPRPRINPPFSVWWTIAVCCIGVLACTHLGLAGELLAIFLIGMFLAEHIECHMVYSEATDKTLLRDAAYFTGVLSVAAIVIFGTEAMQFWVLGLVVGYGALLFRQAHLSLTKSHQQRRFP